MPELMLSYDGYGVPEHTRKGIEDYLIRGYPPGRFVTTIMANDLVGACSCCDHINRDCIVDIAKWVLIMAPSWSWGSYTNVENWLKDRDGIRTKYAEEIEKKFIWDKLSQT